MVIESRCLSIRVELSKSRELVLFVLSLLSLGSRFMKGSMPGKLSVSEKLKFDLEASGVRLFVPTDIFESARENVESARENELEFVLVRVEASGVTDMECMLHCE